MSLGRLTRLMKKYTVSHSVTAAPAAARLKINKNGSLLKLGLDMHRDRFVVVAQYARTPKEMLKSKVVELQPAGNPYVHVAALILARRTFSRSAPM